MKELNEEKIASVLHEFWMEWAKNLMETENISVDRKTRWSKYCIKPYDQLDESMKDIDRRKAREFISKMS